MGQPPSDIPSNISSESAHRTANFPFSEGNPFTATLWVGSEGFHMTVNGRHETSFAYREVCYRKRSTAKNIKTLIAMVIPTLYCFVDAEA